MKGNNVLATELKDGIVPKDTTIMAFTLYKWRLFLVDDKYKMYFIDLRNVPTIYDTPITMESTSGISIE